MPIYSGKLWSGYSEYLCAADAAPRSVTIIALAGQSAWALYHDFGAVGLLSVLSLLLLTLFRLLKMILSGSKSATPLLASILGVAGIGVISSVFDVPQLTFLLYL